MEEKSARRNVKASVFQDIFIQKENALKLYKVLHPEDENTTVDDICNINIENILTNDLYNDLGFVVHDRLVILVEAQSTWTENILIRTVIYLAETFRRYSRDNAIDLYSSTKAVLPVPELYVIYTGDKEVPDRITLRNDFFGKGSDIDSRITVIKESDKSDIVGQYIIFCKVVSEQIKEKGRTREAIESAIRICINRDILKEYLHQHEGDVVTMMMSLFDQEEVTKISLAAKEREGMEKGLEQGLRQGLSQGLEQGKAQMVKNSLAYGNSVAQTAIILGLSEEEVISLSKL